MKPVRNILVGVDFSEHSEAALELALQLARQLQAKVHLVHAYEIPASVAHAYGVVLPQDVFERVNAAIQERLAQLLKRVSEAGLAGESHLVQGSPPQVIADTAQTVPADLVVMGTRGLTGLKHVLLGSVAERTLRIAPCPVVTVKTASA